MVMMHAPLSLFTTILSIVYVFLSIEELNSTLAYQCGLFRNKKLQVVDDRMQQTSIPFNPELQTPPARHKLMLSVEFGWELFSHVTRATAVASGVE